MNVVQTEEDNSRFGRLPHHRKAWKAESSAINVTLVHSHDDLMKSMAVRAAVYVGELKMPYDDCFDGNDLFATHILATVHGEPAGCMRIRFFGEFAKPERLAVLEKFRTRRFGARGVAHALGRFSFDHCAQKGYQSVLGHARGSLVKFWASFGEFKPKSGGEYQFYGEDTVTMVGTLSPPADAVRLNTDPLIITQREGTWGHGNAPHA